jgi:YegS/Rv2252/BmrU family lipid kinase
MVKEKVLFYYNPHAGNGLFKNNLDYIIERFQLKGLRLVPVRAGQNGLLDGVFSKINPEEYRQVVAAGGDGTLNICVNAMIRNQIHLPLAIFPSGTANDFAHYLELPTDIKEMTDIALGHRMTESDVGVVNGRAFINVSAMGMMVDVSQRTDPVLKNTLGALAYYLKGLTEFPNLSPLPVRVESAEVNYQGDMYFMLVMNGTSAGGFRKLSPDSAINDGKLAVTIFKKMPITDFASLLLSYIQGNHQSNRNVIHFKTEEVRVDSPVNFGTDVDGEPGEKLPLHFTILKKRFRIYTYMDNMRGPVW